MSCNASRSSICWLTCPRMRKARDDLSHHQRGAQVTPSPLNGLNGERDGVRGEKGTKRSPSPAVASIPASARRSNTRKQRLILCWMLWIALACAPTTAQTSGRFEFTRLVAHWSDYGNPE